MQLLGGATVAEPALVCQKRHRFAVRESEGLVSLVHATTRDKHTSRHARVHGSSMQRARGQNAIGGAAWPSGAERDLSRYIKGDIVYVRRTSALQQQLYNTLQNYKQRSAARNGGQRNVMRTTTTNVVRTIAPARNGGQHTRHAQQTLCGPLNYTTTSLCTRPQWTARKRYAQQRITNTLCASPQWTANKRYARTTQTRYARKPAMDCTNTSCTRPQHTARKS